VSVPLSLREADVAAHFTKIGAILDTRVDSSARVRIDADWGMVPLVAGLIGKGCESTPRNRGSDVFVAPMLHLKSGLWAWLGYREDWDGEPSAGRVRRFSFRSAGLTVHFGYRNVRHKPQMFRAEWAGWARWNGTNYSHQAGDAAHPHWQFDVLESLKRDDASERAATFLSVLKSEEGSAEPREFRPQTLDDDDVGDMIGVQELSRIHFASAAAWWKSQPGGIHAHAPSKAEDIQVWLRETLIYLLRELGRLQAV
jgi:hypothetical protein